MKIILLTMDARQRRLRRSKESRNKLANKKEQQRLYKISVENELNFMEESSKTRKSINIKKQLRD